MGPCPHKGTNMRNEFIFRVLLLTAAVGVFTGCKQNTPPIANESADSLIPPTPPTADQLNGTLTRDLKYYSKAYEGGPSGDMKSGTKVMVVKQGPSYTLVEAEDGTHGWVDTDGVQTTGAATTGATPTPPAPTTPAPTTPAPTTPAPTTPAPTPPAAPDTTTPPPAPTPPAPPATVTPPQHTSPPATPDPAAPAPPAPPATPAPTEK